MITTDKQEAAREAAERAKTKAADAALDRRMFWLVILISVPLAFLILILLEVSIPTILFILGIIAIVAIILDWIEKTKQKHEADDRAGQINDLFGKK